MMLSNILLALFGTINNVYLGQMIGVDALAAVSVFFPVMFFFVAFVMGLSSGATVLIGQAWGAGEPGKVRAVAGATLTVALLSALATPPDILEEAIAYAHHDDHHAADLCLHSADGNVAWCRRHHDAAAGADDLDKIGR